MNFDAEPVNLVRPSMAASFPDTRQEDAPHQSEGGSVPDKKKILMEKTNKFQMQLQQKSLPSKKFARPTSNLDKLREQNTSTTSSTGFNKK